MKSKLLAFILLFCTLCSFAYRQATLCPKCHKPKTACICKPIPPTPTKCTQCGQTNCRTKNKHKKCSACREYDYKCSYRLSHPACEICKKTVKAKVDKCVYDGDHSSNPESIYQEANRRYEDGDSLKAKELIFLAANYGYAEAQYKQALLVQGNSLNEAIEWLTKAAEQDHIKAIEELGSRIFAGLSNSGSDLETAMSWFERGGNLGSAYCQSTLGALYSMFKNDDKKAVYWLEKAVAQNHTGAMSNLATILQRGENGVEGNPNRTLELYKKMYAAGDMSACVNIGECYHLGIGTPKDDTEALKWYLKGAESGDAVAAFNLFVSYYNGEGTDKNRAEAYKWLEKSLSQSDQKVINSALGVVANAMKGRSWDLAARILILLADKEFDGVEQVQYWLAQMYLHGRGVTKSAEKYAEWMDKSAKGGCAQALKDLGLPTSQEK